MRFLPLALFYVLLPAGAQQLSAGAQQFPAGAQRLSAVAQQPPAGEPTVKFQSSTQLVVETVMVKDKSGKPVEGLGARDFTITEDGVPQAIAFCEYQKLVDNAEPAPAGPPPAPNAPTVIHSQIAAEKPGQLQYRDRRLLAIYFDMTAMPVPDQLRAVAAAHKFIGRQMQSPDLVAIIGYTGGALKVMQDFTSDRSLLNQAIDTLIAGEGLGNDETDTDAASIDTGAAFGQDDAEFNIFNTDRQLAALQTAATMLGHLNEKKALIYFASGLRLNGVDNQAQLQATINAAIRANVSFYAIDARGLVASAPLGDATQGSPGGVAMYSGGSALAMTGRWQRTQDTLHTLSSDTGGKALFDSNDLAAGIVAAQQAVSSYYVIGYYSQNSNFDGKFRRIKIAVKDVAATLAYRQGYYASKQFAKFTTADKERQLEDALMLGDPITELTIAMEVGYFQLNRAEYFVPVAVKIPGSELARARRGGAERTLIDFIGEVKDEYGTTITNVRDKVDIKLSGETAAQLTKHPIEYDTGFTLLPGNYSLKFLARDAETGRIGTFLYPFTVPNLNKETARVPISSVILSSQRVDLREALFTVAKDKDQAAVNPLVRDGQKLIPSVTRVFSKARDMYVYLQAYERAAASTQPLVAFVTFYRGRTKAFETPPLPVTEGLDPKTKALPLRFSFSLDMLLPGRYTCQVTVLDPTSQKAAFWQAPVMLVP